MAGSGVGNDPQIRARRLGLWLAVVVAVLFAGPIVAMLLIEWSRPVAR